MFFDKTCTISAISYTTLDWTAKRVYTPVYTGISCNFEQNKSLLRGVEISESSKDIKYTVVMPVEYNDVKVGYLIELTDPTLWNMGKYMVASIDASKSLSGVIDCITLYCQITKWQL